MKKFENRFVASVELRAVATDVVVAKVTTSLRLDRMDGAAVSGRILWMLLPNWVECRYLYDGSYLIFSRDESASVSVKSVPSVSRSLGAFDMSVELEDGTIHSIHVSLEQSNSERCDYSVPGSRYIQLRGVVSVEVDDNEEVDA